MSLAELTNASGSPAWAPRHGGVGPGAWRRGSCGLCASSSRTAEAAALLEACPGPGRALVRHEHVREHETSTVVQQREVSLMVLHHAHLHHPHPQLHLGL